MAGNKRGRKPGKLYGTTLHVSVLTQHKQALAQIADGMSRIQGKTVSVAEVARILIEGGLSKQMQKVSRQVAELDRPRHEPRQVESDEPPPPQIVNDRTDATYGEGPTQEQIDAALDGLGMDDDADLDDGPDPHGPVTIPPVEGGEA